jgi:RNA polymerase sigma factor (TIGR02999 family)
MAGEVTQILEAMQSGQATADELIALVYDELRRLAMRELAGEQPGQTLQTTALVHEAYLRLLGSGEQSWENRRHFFGAAAEAMRRILVDSARRKRCSKHGGNWARRELDDGELAAPPESEDVLAVDEALEKLAVVDQQAAELVKLRSFAGMTMQEIARIMGVSTRTADRIWAFARAWLHEEIRSNRK